MADYVSILGIKINKVNMGQAINEVENIIKADKKMSIVTPNSEMIVLAQQDRELARIINTADLKIPDGAGVVLASRLYRNPVTERVAGYDLMQKMLMMAAEKNNSVYLLGGEEKVIELAVKKIKDIYPTINICGYHHGFLDETTSEKVLNNINKLNPNILFIGMGVPLQEKFLNDIYHNINVNIAMTVGGSFDVLAEKVKRAPRWMQKMHLEWFYRLIQEPWRLGRMMALPKFAWMVIKDNIKDR
ncbi:MAG: WecB/TagA/CpsF family glycosyltransferase [Halanaerobiaceae bacterium]